MQASWQRRRFLALWGAALAAPAARADADAAWPQRPLHLVVPLPPGSSSDILVRTMAPLLAQHFGQRVEVHNVTGNSSSKGAKQVAGSAPDGHTVLLSNSVALSVAPHWLRPRPYHPLHHFEHVSLIGIMPTALLVPGSLPLDDFKSLLTWIQQQPGRVKFGSVGTTSVGHVVGMQLARSLQLPLEHVTYPSIHALRNDLVAAKIALGIDALPPHLPLILNGKLKAAAITAANRADQAPYIPCIAELGYPALAGDNFLGLSAPAGLPDIATRAWMGALHHVCSHPQVQHIAYQQGFTLMPSTSGQFTKLVAEQFKAWGALAPAPRKT